MTAADMDKKLDSQTRSRVLRLKVHDGAARSTRVV